MNLFIGFLFVWNIKIALAATVVDEMTMVGVLVYGVSRAEKLVDLHPTKRVVLEGDETGQKTKHALYREY